MTKGKRCSLDVPHLALYYKVLREFYADHGKVKRTYLPWSILIGWLAMYFAQVHKKCMPRTFFYPSFIPCMSMISRVNCYEHSTLFWYQELASIQPYWFNWNASQKMIKDDDAISLKDFSCLVVCHLSVLLY